VAGKGNQSRTKRKAAAAELRSSEVARFHVAPFDSWVNHLLQSVFQPEYPFRLAMAFLDYGLACMA